MGKLSVRIATWIPFLLPKPVTREQYTVLNPFQRKMDLMLKLLKPSQKYYRIRDIYLGSMTSKVLRRVRKPVFIIPLPKSEGDLTFHDF